MQRDLGFQQAHFHRFGSFNAASSEAKLASGSMS